jgi:hypothetical protein
MGEGAVRSTETLSQHRSEDNGFEFLGRCVLCLF